MIPRAAFVCTRPARADKRSLKAKRSTPQGLTNDDEVGCRAWMGFLTLRTCLMTSEPTDTQTVWGRTDYSNHPPTASLAAVSRPAMI